MPDHETDDERPAEATAPPASPVREAEPEVVWGPPDVPFAPQPDQHFFGLKQNVRPDRVPPAPVYSDDYEKRFPPDPYCEETGPNARVWRVYLEETAAFDATMIGESRDGLDVMLVFAGLFSAVVTSFLVQVSQSLQADFSQMSAVLLHDLVSIQLAMADTSSFPNITSPSVNPNETFTPDSITVWINGLWLVSLTASLSVALAAVLIKQWLHHYTSLPSGTPGIRSHVRQFRFMGLEQWRVSVIIGLLPIIMHTSLALFLCGLVLFYIPLRTSLAWVVGVLTVVVATLYIVSNVMPIFFPQCPYHTPLTQFAYDILRVIHIFLRRLHRSLKQKLMHHTSSEQKHSDTQNDTWLHSLAKLEATTVHSLYDQFSVHALDLLFHLSSNPTVHSVVIQAIGGLPATAEVHTLRIWNDQQDMRLAREELIRQYTVPSQLAFGEICRDPRPGYKEALERVCRSWIFLPRNPSRPRWLTIIVDSPVLHALPAVRASVLINDDGQTHKFKWPTEPPDFRALFSMHHTAKFHPLVWRNLVELASSVAPETFQLGDPYFNDFVSAHLMTVFLSSLRQSDPKPVLHSRHPAQLNHPATLTLQDATQAYFQRFMHQCLANMLSPFYEDVPLSDITHCRILVAAGEFAVRHVSQHGYLERAVDSSLEEEWRHLQLLDLTLHELANQVLFDTTWDSQDESEPPHLMRRMRREDVLSPDELSALSKLLQNVVHHTTLCDYGNDYRDQPQGNLVIRSVASLLCIYAWLAQRDGTFSFPYLHQILLVPVYQLNRTPSDMPSWSNFYLYDRAFEVMEIGLARGLETAYRLFIEMDWLRLLSDDWAINHMSGPQSIPLRGYICGLSSVKSDTARQEFLDHLHEPRNLTLTFLITTTDCFSSWNAYDQTNVDTQMSCLMNLWPTHPSWIECKATAQVLLAWVESPDRDTAQFPLADLINGFHLTVIRRTHISWMGWYEKLHTRLERGLHLLDNNLKGVELEQ